MTKSNCCFPKMTSNVSSKRWNNANSMTYQNYSIENKYTPGSGVGSISQFARRALLSRCTTNECCNKQ